MKRFSSNEILVNQVLIPEQVTEALKIWHAAAIKFDPSFHSDEASARARAAWTAFEEECLKWERSARAAKRGGVFGPTGTGRA